MLTSRAGAFPRGSNGRVAARGSSLASRETARACVAAAVASVGVGVAALSFPRRSHAASMSSSSSSSATTRGAPRARAAAAAPSAGDPPASICEVSAGGGDVQSDGAKARGGGVLAALNESTKFVVSALALVALLRYPNVSTCWCILGSVVNSINGKLLKKLLNHERPTGAVKADPGMPSSHATSLSYLSVYAAAAMLTHGDKMSPVLPAWAVAPTACGVVGCGVFLTWLRVHLGFHTTPQVVVGYALGASTAVGWLCAMERVVGPALRASPKLVGGLRVALAVAVGVFALSAIRWVDEARAYLTRGKSLGDKAE